VRAIAEVVQVMIEGVREGRVINLNAVKNEAARRHGLKRTPKLVELISAVPDEHRDALLPQLRAKPVRTASGIAVVAVMSKPHRCPHIATTGNICVYCPGVRPVRCCSPLIDTRVQPSFLELINIL